ncbi:hypothetical protein N7509_005530 [Penicillium cosmopolitanum]|uniref:Uncharacterized protein n=1 Tax=Penicillium cosmopolitanum TaxID=1131564 RepID=A0A9W9W2P2_9EURO|nr:uncharacterized protein N7509_005530 [Penicillium cosmopolitanum]KAJ5397417.1 hypothetical protein N7509_005530 [Penicillium cosmopolitanum]
MVISANLRENIFGKLSGVELVVGFVLHKLVKMNRGRSDHVRFLLLTAVGLCRHRQCEDIGRPLRGLRAELDILLQKRRTITHAL